MRRSGDKALADGGDAPLERAVVAGESRAGRLLAARPDQLHHGLRLREAELAVEKRPPRELARSGRARPRLIQCAQRAAQQIEPAMAGELRHVFAREARGCAVVDGDCLIDGALPVVHAAIVDRVALLLCKAFAAFGRKHLVCDLLGARP